MKVAIGSQEAWEALGETGQQKYYAHYLTPELAIAGGVQSAELISDVEVPERLDKDIKWVGKGKVIYKLGD